MKLVELLSVFIVLGCFTVETRANDGQPSPEQLQFFESKVRPVFVEYCHKCHAGDKLKGDLRVDSREALLEGGESGAAIVPGKPDASLLIEAINYKGHEMPPDRRLPEAKIADITAWVKMGAPWPMEAAASGSKPRKSKELSDEDRAYWAFQPIKAPATPKLTKLPQPPHQIDAFISAKLEEKGLVPNGAATPRELIRRAYYDLIGLPPTPEAVTAYEAACQADKTTQPFRKLIDELLAKPQYGERWGRHWLDVVRFAQTNGYERDDEKMHAWRYRDYVIRAFNQDKPYDRFITEQLAGDELPNATPDSHIATGFYRLGVWDDEADDARQAEFDDLDDVIVATSASFLGLTVGCARCHDHKFDPISHEDYYRMLSFFRGIQRYSNPQPFLNSSTFLPIEDREKVSKAFTEMRARQEQLKAKLASTTDKAEREKLERQIRDETLPGIDWTLGVRERGTTAPATHVLIRGNSGNQGVAVEPAFLSVLGGTKPETVPHDGVVKTTGRRLALARWIASPSNPLTARVLVNRVWKHHFGQGIAKTTTDFGKTGIPPTHPELLDWLADSFLQGGWSIKALHRQIMLSETYRRSSKVEQTSDAGPMMVDPGNDYLWRQNLHRLDAESVRDTLLAVSGQLSPEAGGRGFFPKIGGEALAGSSKPGYGWELSTPQQRNRRSVYTFIKRTLTSPWLDSFDYANVSAPLGERPVTTVAPQALLLLNDEFAGQQAASLADRVVAEVGADPRAQLKRAYQLALQRNPTEREIDVAHELLLRQRVSQQRLRGRITFKPDVPISLHTSYMNRLQPSDYLAGPKAGWSFTRGRWGGGYEGIMNLDVQRGPAAFWDGAQFYDGVVAANLMVHNASELAAILVRARPDPDVFQAYEVLLSPRDQTVSLVRHTDKRNVLATQATPIPTLRALPIRIETAGPRVRVWLHSDPAPVIDFTDDQPLAGMGHVGVRTWGAAVTLDDLTFEAGGQKVAVGQSVVAPSPDGKSLLSGWRHFGSKWIANTDGSYAVSPGGGIKAVWDDVHLQDGAVEANLKLLQGGDVGLLLRVTQAAEGTDALHAYNINLTHDIIRIGKHRNNWQELVRAPLTTRPGDWRHVRAEITGAQIKVFVDNAATPILEFSDPEPLPAGSVGLRGHSAKGEFRNLQVAANGKTFIADFAQASHRSGVIFAPMTAAVDDSVRQALASICLMILNLNEVIYVD